MSNTIDCYINSANRLSGHSPENFEIKLSNLTTKNLKAFTVRSLTIPQTYYNVNSNNNALVWVDGNSVSHTSTIQVGYYTNSELITAVQSKLNGDKDAGDVNVYTVALGTNSEKITISADTNNFELKFADTSTTCERLLGYESTNLSGATSYTADNIANLRQDLNYIFVESDLAMENNMNIAGDTRRNYISYMSTSGFGTIASLEDAQYVKKLRSSNLSSIYLRLVDEAGNQIDLNGMDWSMIITFITD